MTWWSYRAGWLLACHKQFRWLTLHYVIAHVKRHANRQKITTNTTICGYVSHASCTLFSPLFINFDVYWFFSGSLLELLCLMCMNESLCGKNYHEYIEIYLVCFECCCYCFFFCWLLKPFWEKLNYLMDWRGEMNNGNTKRWKCFVDGQNFCSLIRN